MEMKQSEEITAGAIAQSLGRRITRAEAIKISHEIMENAEKMRKEAAEKEARAFWELNEDMGYFPEEVEREATKRFEERCINTGLNFDDPTELIRAREELKQLRNINISLLATEKTVEEVVKRHTEYYCPICGEEAGFARCLKCGQKLKYSFEEEET
jgi:hypothetical protein